MHNETFATNITLMLMKAESMDEDTVKSLCKKLFFGFRHNKVKFEELKNVLKERMAFWEDQGDEEYARIYRKFTDKANKSKSWEQ